MAEHLVLSVNADSGDVTAVALNGDGQLLARPESVSLEDAAALAGDRQITVMLPAREIVSCVAKIPATSPGKLRQMLPFTLEDEFVGDVEELHFAAGERNDADLLAVSVIAKDRLDFWLERLRQAGIQARRICSEADAVPDTPGVVTLFVEHDKILGRRPSGAPFEFTELSLTALWQLLTAERKDGDELDRVVMFIESETRQQRQTEIDAWREQIGDLDIKELADGCLPRLASNLVHSPGINLLQGSYAPRSSLTALARPWRTAAGFLLAFVALGLLGKAAVVWKLTMDSERLREEIASICTASYTSAQFNDCRLEMLRRLDSVGQTASGSGSGYLSTQATIAEAAGNGLRMENMSYRDGVLRLVFVAPNVPFVETFSRAITQSGRFQVRDQSTSAEENGVETRLSIVEQSR